MAHELSFKAAGNAELVLGSNTAGWHHFGTVFPQGVPLADAMQIAFPFTAIKEQLTRQSTGQLSNVCGIYRSDNGFELGSCSAGYELIQPPEMFDFLSAFFQESGMYIESAGALKGGSVLFCQAKIGTLDVLGSGDKHHTYMTFNNSFDGSIKAQAYITSVREVCWNTVNMGLTAKNGLTLSWKHTKHVHNKMEEQKALAKQLLIGKVETTAHLQEVLDTLAQRKLTRKTYEAILDTLFPGDSTRSRNVKAQVTELFADNDHNAFPDFAGTGYALLNAVTNYADHVRSVRMTSHSSNTDVVSQRYETALLPGEAGSKLKEKALERILVMSDGSECVEHTDYYDMGATSIIARQETAPPPIPEVIVSATSVAEGSTGMADEEPITTVDTASVPLMVVLYTNAPKEYDSSLTTETNPSVRKIQGKLWREVTLPAAAMDYQSQIYERQDYECCTQAEWQHFLS